MRTCRTSKKNLPTRKGRLLSDGNQHRMLRSSSAIPGLKCQGFAKQIKINWFVVWVHSKKIFADPSQNEKCKVNISRFNCELAIF